jgi:hypothetical protein
MNAFQYADLISFRWDDEEKGSLVRAKDICLADVTIVRVLVTL